MPRPLASRIVGFTLALVVAVGLGVVTTVGVAWRSSTSLPPLIRYGAETLRFPTSDRCGLAIHSMERAGGIDVTVQSGMITRMGGPFDADPGRAEARVPAWARDLLVPWGWDGAWRPGMRSIRHLVVRGWPWGACFDVFEAQIDTPDGPAGWTLVAPDGTAPRLAVGGGLSIPGGVPQGVPARLVWTGFLADTAVFTAAWLVAIGGLAWIARAARRRIRARRGQCPSCGYPWRGSPDAPRCPECGGAIAAR